MRWYSNITKDYVRFQYRIHILSEKKEIKAQKFQSLCNETDETDSYKEESRAPHTLSN